MFAATCILPLPGPGLSVMFVESDVLFFLSFSFFILWEFVMSAFFFF